MLQNDLTHAYTGIYSENTETAQYNGEVETTLNNLGIDPTNSSWAIRYNPSSNTISLYVAVNHKLEFNGDRYKSIAVQIYTGTVSGDSVSSWSTPTSGTCKVTYSTGTGGGYVRLNV